ncbi:MAG TPA: glycosyltransferase family 2 protein [Burkholderiaceae bacterium]|nr:glycosyltransferase family 2 protein [Burkholderiaceae bacterium]
MKVSIITVCRNAAATIEDTIRSVLAQDYAEIEYLIVDGASTDETVRIAERYRKQHGERLVRVISEPDRGQYDSMNKGIAAATGDVLGFLHADDFFAAPSTISSIARAFTERQVDCVYGDLDFVHPDDTARVVRRWRSQPYEPGASLRGWCPPHPTLYIKRPIFLKMGGFSLRYKIAADIDFMTRLFECERASSHHVPEVLVIMRAGGASNKNLRNIARANWESWIAARRAGLRVGPWYMLRKPLSRVKQLFHRDPSPDVL